MTKSLPTLILLAVTSPLKWHLTISNLCRNFASSKFRSPLKTQPVKVTDNGTFPSIIVTGCSIIAFCTRIPDESRWAESVPASVPIRRFARSAPEILQSEMTSPFRTASANAESSRYGLFSADVFGADVWLYPGSWENVAPSKQSNPAKREKFAPCLDGAEIDSPRVYISSKLALNRLQPKKKLLGVLVLF